MATRREMYFQKLDPMNSHGQNLNAIMIWDYTFIL